MIILSDTDVVRKLACCDLLLEFLQFLKSPPNEIWVLPSLQYQLKAWLSKCPQELQRVGQFMAKVRKVPPARDETLERLSSLDVGEQHLMALLCDEPRVKHLVTGDKRALDKVAGLSRKDSLLMNRLNETSVFCFEAILLGLIKSRGFGLVQARVLNKWAKLPGQKVDGIVMQAFPVGGTEEFATRVLSDRLMELKVSLQTIQFA